MKTFANRSLSVLICYIIAVSLFSTTIQAQTPPTNLSGYDLRSWLKTNYYDGQHNQLSYSQARKKMYGYIDNHNNQVECVYSGYKVNVTYGSSVTYPAPVNCEHTVPQSFFNEAMPMKSDIHHLFPTYENWNAKRSNSPFKDVADNRTTDWMRLNQNQNNIPAVVNIDEYSEYRSYFFEPREAHKGNVARALFYFYTMYPTQAGDIDDVASFSTLCRWHQEDPVDANEISRNDKIEQYQGNRNPYIDYPNLAYEAWGCSSGTTAINEIDSKALQFTITPNPVTNYLRLQYNNASASSIRWEIIGLNGRIISSNELSTQQSMIDIATENLTSGVYFLRVSDNKQVQVQKFIKQ